MSSLYRSLDRYFTSFKKPYLTKLVLIDIFLMKKNKPLIFEWYSDRSDLPNLRSRIAENEIPRQVDKLSLTKTLLTIDDHQFVKFVADKEEEVYYLLQLSERQFKKMLTLEEQDDFYQSFPKEINEFILELFDVSNDRKNLLQIYSKNSNFLPLAIEKNAAISYYCFETNVEYFAKTFIDTFLMSDNLYLNHTDDVSKPPYFEPTSDATFGMIYANYTADFPKIPDDVNLPIVEKKPESIKGPVISIKQLIKLVERKLSEEGKAVLVLPRRFFVSSFFRETREYLVKSELIEFVIQLPYDIRGRDNSLNLLVMRHKSPMIKFFDATQFTKNETRSSRVLDVEAALNTLYSPEANKHIANVATKEVGDEYILDPMHYLSRVFSSEIRQVKLSEICEFFTGWQASKEMLDRLFDSNDNELKSTQILQISDMDNFTVYASKKRFLLDDKRYQQFGLQVNDVILTTKTAKVKTAVIHSNIHARIIASGGIMVLRPNVDLINPYYLQAFFESDLGQNQFNSLETGDIGKGLTVNRVKNIMIPLADREAQENISEQFKNNIDAISMYSRQIEKRKRRNLTLFQWLKD